MDTNKIDQFFKENLEAATSLPSQQAWENLDMLIDKKKKKAVFWYCKIAASVILLLFTGVLSYKLFFYEEIKGTVAGVIENIQYENTEASKITLLKIDSAKKSRLNHKNKEDQVREQNLATRVKQSDKHEIRDKESKDVIEGQQYVAVVGSDEEIERLALQKDLLIIELDNVELTDHDGMVSSTEAIANAVNQPNKSNKKRSVRITYKSTPKKEVRRRVVIVAKLDTTKHWRPDIRNILKLTGSLLADVRDAKDNIFNSK